MIHIFWHINSHTLFCLAKNLNTKLKWNGLNIPFQEFLNLIWILLISAICPKFWIKYNPISMQKLPTCCRKSPKHYTEHKHNDDIYAYCSVSILTKNFRYRIWQKGSSGDPFECWSQCSCPRWWRSNSSSQRVFVWSRRSCLASSQSWGGSKRKR